MLLGYMIAVGGAGSSGRPALASGIRTITKISTASPIRPEIQCAFANTFGSVWPVPTMAAITNPQSAYPAINPDAVSTPAFSTRAFWASL